LRTDESGLALIYVTATLPVIIGFALLAVDVGRFMSLNSSLQHGADALALAGAAELDGRPDAITRSEDAMKQFVTQNTALFTSSVATIDWAAVDTCYLASLPANDSDPIPPGNCLPTSTPTDVSSSSPSAKFVQVVVQPKQYDTIFPATFVGALSNTTQTDAEAVAGFQAAVCNFTPLFMCNPFEPTTGATSSLNDYGLIAHAQDPLQRRKAIRFLAVATGGTATAVPGQYGFLDPATGKGKKALGEEIAALSPEACYIQDKIDTKTGDMADLRHAFNTRFDLYKGSYGKVTYPPATNVRKGYVAAKIAGKSIKPGDACKATENILAQNPNAFLALPVDSCFKTGSCGSNIGNGDWKWDPELPGTLGDVKFTQYWTTNFGTTPIPTPADLGLTGATPYSDASPPSRYDLYKYENTKVVGGKLLREMATDPTKAPPTGGTPYAGTGVSGEKGTPNCQSPGIDTPDRRIVYGAILNCRAEGLRPGNSDYNAFAFGKFFMIRPMPSTPDSDLWVELVDVVRPGDGTGVARDIVQLYR
jgi:Flp pilus assembly protein TadG